MNLRNSLCVFTLLFAIVIYVATSQVSQIAAQDGNRADLGLHGSRQDVDSYWLDQHTWLQYGYRPYVKTTTRRFVDMPSYFSGGNSYSYGDMPATGISDANAKLSTKKSIQMTKYGTWN